jgi:D-alanyl-D-alanine carboxypeptidase
VCGKILTIKRKVTKRNKMINKKIFILMTTVMIFLPKSGQAGLENEVQALLKKHHLSESNLGLYVEDNGEKLIQVNAEKLMIPASLTKIVTGGAVLQNISLGSKI